MHLLEFTITKRDLVNGPNLMLKELIPTTTEEVPFKDIQYGYLKPKIEPETSSLPEPIPEPIPEPAPELTPKPRLDALSELKIHESEMMKEKIDDLGTIGGKRDEIAGRLYRSEIEEVKSGKIEVEDAKEEVDRMEVMLRKPSMKDQLEEAKMSLNAMDSVIEEEFGEDKVDYVEAKFEKFKEKEKALPPPSGSTPPPPGSAPGGPPKSPQTLRGNMTQELKGLFKKKEEKKPEPPSGPPASSPASPPAGPPAGPPVGPPTGSVSGSGTPSPSPVHRYVSAKASIREPTPPPPPSLPSSEPAKKSATLAPPSPKKKKKGKKMVARLRSFAEESEETAPILEKQIHDEGIADDIEEVEEVEEREEEILSDFAEISAPMEMPASLESTILPELAEVAKEIETRKEYQKNIAIEYFDKMNPKKYYPLIIDISDIEQATTISEENILTGERKTQVKEKMTVFLKSSIVKVKPMFPGCSIVPEERYTDLDKKEDKLTFYVTPLVDDEIEDGRVEFIDSEGNIFHSAATPSKVEDPKYARMIALYGGLVSFLPKIFETLGFSFAADTKMATIFPFLQIVLGDMNLSNFIGISGILITIVISIITMVVRKPNSVKKKFKVARVGRLKSAINLQE
ncbi:MAG: hypothetical protein C5S38_01775 [Candidatus Methanophagaceae archaeon]|nr:MAG: hypothetical protein C5S38_01775 [Methanophagales archaeon]